uniref:Uncharacterized protein n=1 Tax=Ditylenchus dipsaci TaxID=166011 RepID=A0A915E5Q7_9BILA
MALAFPILNTGLMIGEMFIYFVQHILIVSVPFYLMSIKDTYSPESRPAIHGLCFSASLLVLYHFLFLQTTSMTSLSLDEIDILRMKVMLWTPSQNDVLLADRKCQSVGFRLYGSTVTKQVESHYRQFGNRSYRTPKGEALVAKAPFSAGSLPLKIGTKEMKRPGLVVNRIVPPDVDCSLLGHLRTTGLPSGLVLIDLLKRTIRFDQDVVIPLIASLSVVMPDKFLDVGGAEQELNALSAETAAVGSPVLTLVVNDLDNEAVDNVFTYTFGDGLHEYFTSPAIHPTMMAIQKASGCDSSK